MFTSFVDFVQLAAGILGYEPDVVGTSNTPEGVFARGGCVALQEKLGFTAKRSFREGVAAALEYYSK